MTSMTNITVRVPQWMKAEMERHRDVNWAEVVRSCIRTKLAQFKHPTTIDQLVERYLREGDMVKLRTLDIFAELLDNYCVTHNIQLIYGEEAVEKAQEVLEDLKAIGIERRYDKIGNLTAEEAIIYALEEMGVYDKFEGELAEKLRFHHLKDAVWLVSQYEYDIVPDGFERTYRIMTGTESVLDELVKLGVLYKDYYESRAYNHWFYKVPIYASTVVEKGAEEKKMWVRNNLRELVKTDWFKNFLKWMGGPVKYIDAYEEESVKASYKRNFDADLSELIKKGIVIIDYFPRRRRAGKRKSSPPFWMIKITPAAMDAMPELVFELL